MAHAVQLQGTVLADGPYSVHWGVCNTPQCPTPLGPMASGHVLVSGGWCEACWAAHVAWHGRPYFVPPEFRLREAIILRCGLIMQIASLRGTPLDIFFIIYHYYYIFIKTQPPPGRRTMAHRSHGHMGSQGEGCPPLVIYIYI